MATSSLEVWDDKPNHSACRVRGYRTPPSQDQRRDRSPGPAATRQPGRTADPLRQHRLPLPRRPAAAPRALPDLDPQGRQQDRHPHPGHHPSRRPAPADGELPATTRTHHRTRDPRAPAAERRPDPARPLTGLSARALRRARPPTPGVRRSWNRSSVRSTSLKAAISYVSAARSKPTSSGRSTWPATTSASSQGPDGQPPSWPPPEGEGGHPAAQPESAPLVTCDDLDAHPPQFRQASPTPSNGHRLCLGRRLPQQPFRTQGPSTRYRTSGLRWPPGWRPSRLRNLLRANATRQTFCRGRVAFALLGEDPGTGAFYDTLYLTS